MNDVLSVLRCENCGGMVGGEDLQPENGVAVCSLCRTVLVLAKPPELAPRTLPAPRHFEQVSGSISWREPPWRSAVHLILAVAWTSVAAQKEPLVILFAGCIAYPALVRLVNRKFVTFDGRTLQARQCPLPWRFAVSIPASAIDHVFTFEEPVKTRGGSRTWCVAAELKSGPREVLVDGLAEQHHAQYLEQQLKAWLELQ